MKKLLFILTALLMASSAMAMRTVVFTPSIDKDESTGGNVSNGSYTLSKHGVTIYVSSGYITNDYYRFNAGSSITLSLDIDWETLYEGDTRFHHMYYPIDGYKHLRVYVPDKGKTTMGFNEIFAFGEGEIPDWVQQWKPVPEKTEMLFLATHPDDDILFLIQIKRSEMHGLSLK